MPMRDLHLTEHFDNFVQAGVRSGQFSNASEVAREGLRLLEQRLEEEKAKLVWLRGAIQEDVDAARRGEYTAPPTSSTVSDYLHNLRTR